MQLVIILLKSNLGAKTMNDSKLIILTHLTYDEQHNYVKTNFDTDCLACTRHLNPCYGLSRIMGDHFRHSRKLKHIQCMQEKI